MEATSATPTGHQSGDVGSAMKLNPAGAISIKLEMAAGLRALQLDHYRTRVPVKTRRSIRRRDSVKTPNSSVGSDTQSTNSANPHLFQVDLGLESDDRDTCPVRS